MAKQRQKLAPVRGNAVNTILTAAAFLCLGIGIGYYFGRSTAAVPASAPAVAEGQGSSASGPAFMQEEARLKSILKAKPDDAAANIQLGNLYFDNERYGDAVDYYRKALEIDPSDVNVRTDLGTCYWNQNRPDDAIAEFKKSLEVSPNHPQTLYNLGVVYLHGKNDAAAAGKVWEKLASVDPEYAKRANIGPMIESLRSVAATESMKVSPASGAPDGKSETKGVEDLLKRMKQRP